MRQTGRPCGALAGVFERLEVAGVTQRHGACIPTPTRASFIIVEHVGRARGAVHRPDSRPRRASPPGVMRAFAEVQHGVGDAAVAHLVVQPGQHDVVALTDRTSASATNFGTMNSEMPFVPGGRPGSWRARGCTMFSVSSWSRAGDPHLGSEEPVGAVVLRFGTGCVMSASDEPASGLRQRHRAGESALEHRPDAGARSAPRVPNLASRLALAIVSMRYARRADVGRRRTRQRQRPTTVVGSCAPPRSWSIDIGHQVGLRRTRRAPP